MQKGIAVFVAIVVWVFPQAANAQLRSLHGIRHLMLAPPETGAENLHNDLTTWLLSKKLLVGAKETLPIDCPGFEPLIPGCRPTYSWSGPGPRSQFAYCALRIGLPKPRSVGLECSDFAGQYVGTIRFTSEDELFSWVRATVPGLPAARPLTGVTHIRVRRLIGDRHRIREYVENVLRADGTFTVVDTDEDPPVSLGERLVSGEINPGSTLAHPKGSFRKPYRTTLVLRDPVGQGVRGFWVDSESVFAPSGKRLEALMRELIRQLVQARVEDAEIYRVPPEMRQLAYRAWRPNTNARGSDERATIELRRGLERAPIDGRFSRKLLLTGFPDGNRTYLETRTPSFFACGVRSGPAG